MHDNLITLRRQAEFFANPAWLKTQSAGELAILHGVLAHKTFRLQGALEAASHRVGWRAGRGVSVRFRRRAHKHLIFRGIAGIVAASAPSRASN